jgi:uncharacterized DUF497 family protein
MERKAAIRSMSGFGFSYATLIFDRPTLERPDNRRDYGEARVQSIGEVGSDVLFVVYTDRGDIRHIISARQASRKERRAWRLFVDQLKPSGE